jgi:hypothetical protein
MLIQEAAGANGLLQVLAGAMLGLFGGVGTTALWELWVRPARDRRNLARLLVTEIRMNRREVEWMIASRRENPDFLPLNLSLATATYDTRSEAVGGLPEELLPEVVELYARFQNINEVGATIPPLLARVEEAAEGSDRKAELAAQLRGRLDALYVGLERCSLAIGAVLPPLLRLADFRSEPPARA